jgi:hypothetical protein
MEDVAKVVVDYGFSKKKNKKDIDTGAFECIYKGSFSVEKPTSTLGLNLCIEGNAIKKKK